MTEKNYLKTVEEISSALAAGKVVYFDNARQDSLKKDENGMIVLENQYEKKLCVGCLLGVDDKPYILEPKPLELKLWHLYQDCHKNKVLVIQETSGEEEKTFLGIHTKDLKVLSYYANGRMFKGNLYAPEEIVKEVADLSEYFK